MIFSACSSQRTAFRNLPKPGKQCKILVAKKYSKPGKKRRRRSRHIEPQTQQVVANNSQLLTADEYLRQIEKYQESLPEFDVNEDCPPAAKKDRQKKRSGLFGLFKRK